MSVAVLIPARDEAPRLPAVLARVRATLPDARVLVIDDGSRDGTGDVARAAGADVLAGEGRGYAHALATGYQALRGARAVVQLDADGQHPPEAAPLLLAALAGADHVFGSRQGTPSPSTWDRRLGNGALACGVALATGTWLADVTCGYQALGPAALALYTRRYPEGVADANVRVYALRAGLRVCEIPVTVSGRSGGASMHDGWRGVQNLARSAAALVGEAVRRRSDP